MADSEHCPEDEEFFRKTPPLLGLFYRELQKHFTPEQAFTIVQTYFVVNLRAAVAEEYREGAPFGPPRRDPFSMDPADDDDDFDDFDDPDNDADEFAGDDEEGGLLR